MRVGQFEAFIPWVGCGSRTVWGLHSMGWMWELDGLKLKFHGLYVGVQHFEVWEFEVFVPWVEHSSRSEEHTSELQSHSDLVCRLLLEKKKKHMSIPSKPKNTSIGCFHAQAQAKSI